MFGSVFKNTCFLLSAAGLLSACSSGYNDRYGEDYAEISSGYYAYGDQAAYSGRYGSSGQMAMTGQQGCAPGGQLYGMSPAMGQGYTGGAYYEMPKSRYGSYEYAGAYGAQGGAMGGGCGGYYMIPTYQVVQTPAPVAPVPAPVTTSIPAVTIQESCPDGQYRMDSGQCAIMMTEEVEQYVPPVTTGYVETSRTPIEYYQPVRK